GRARVGSREVEVADEVVDLRERVDLRELPAQLAAHGVALEVPRGVLADVAAAARLVLVELDEQLGVALERPGDEREVGVDDRRVAAERPRQLAEQPRPAEAAAADDDTVAAGLV